MSATSGDGPELDDQKLLSEDKKGECQGSASEDQQHDVSRRASSDDNDDGEEDPPSNKDFVIRDGFPALRLPGTNKGWMIEGVEPIPRAVVWARGGALKFEHLERWERDCRAVFTAREREQDEPYSAGVTYFCPALMKPRCALEALALSVFHKHCQHLEPGVMIPEQSGAEWWTLVLHRDDENQDKEKTGSSDNGEGGEEDDEGDDVGLHFDADYGLEDQVPNLLLHPRLATVTYLTNHGAPTLVLDQRSPTPDEWHNNFLHNRSIRRGWISHPRTGKHLAFDGRLLHGAPSTFFPACSPSSNDMANADRKPAAAATQDPDSTVDPPDKKRLKLDNCSPAVLDTRITILVNVWVNHCPLDAEPLDDAICESLETPYSPLLPGVQTGQGGETETDGYRSREAEIGQQSFAWVATTDDLAAPPACRRVPLSSSSADPAGEEEFVLCNRLVTAKYGPSMTTLHDACQRSGDDDQADLIELDMGEGVLQLVVGDEVKPEDSDDGSE